MTVGERTRDQCSPRESLLDAAASVMTERGVDVSLQAIAARAGLTAPLIGYYFGDKEGLLRALAKRDTERALGHLRSLLQTDVPADRMLRMHISAIIRNYARKPYLNPLFNRLLHHEASPSARELKENFVDPLAAAQRQILERGVAAGLFRPLDPALAYFMIMGACQYLFNNKVTVKGLLNGELDDAAVNRYADFVTDTLLRGLAA